MIRYNVLKLNPLMIVSLFYYLMGLKLCLGDEYRGSKSSHLPSLSENVDRHAVFTQPLTEGIYKFNSEGYIPTMPLQRIGKIHKEIIKSIQAIGQPKKQIQYILTLSNTANQDIEKLKSRMKESHIEKSTDIDKTKYRADAFVLLVSHAALMGNAILYFPDTMSIILQKNVDFYDNIRWVMQFIEKVNVVNDEKMIKLFNLAQQEIGIIPKLPNYHNPYKASNNFDEEKISTPVVTKKPRKRLQRGPRMSAGEF